jgi:hypothetical protein
MWLSFGNTSVYHHSVHRPLLPISVLFSFRFGAGECDWIRMWLQGREAFTRATALCLPCCFARRKALSGLPGLDISRPDDARLRHYRKLRRFLRLGPRV